jgi:hypothetical protein
MSDEDAAIAALTTLAELSDEQKSAHRNIEEILNNENENPFVDIHQLFSLYNTLYFRSLLLPRVEVSWSARLTLCAGICELVKDDEGKYRRIRLKLSEPLLKYRPRSDTVNTLLHEAIHAYFFITTSWHHLRGDDGTGHGAGFLLLADAINNHGNYEITIYHTFHDEVDAYRKHVWKCDGPCQLQPPYFGLVKRSMNRPPSRNDSWWTKHEEECGGTYTKIMEPQLTKVQIKAMSAKERAGRQKNKIDSWVKASASHHDHKESPSMPKDGDEPSPLMPHVMQDANLASRKRIDPAELQVPSGNKRPSTATDDEHLLKKRVVICPICEKAFPDLDINNHLDYEHAP